MKLIRLKFWSLQKIDYKKVDILTQIVNAQPFLSKYFETTKNVLIFKNKMSALQQKIFFLGIIIVTILT